MTEDKSHSLPTYVDHLCQVHKQIQTDLAK